jgi:hypothetical protein
MTEMKSRLNDDDIYKLFQKIAKSDVKISKLAKASAEQHMPYKLVEPVDHAVRLLNEFDAKKQPLEATDKEINQKNKMLQKRKKSN